MSGCVLKKLTVHFYGYIVFSGLFQVLSRKKICVSLPEKTNTRWETLGSKTRSSRNLSWNDLEVLRADFHILSQQRTHKGDDLSQKHSQARRQAVRSKKTCKQHKRPWWTWTPSSCSNNGALWIESANIETEARIGASIWNLHALCLYV